MNRFLAKKKGKDDGNPRPSVDDSSSPFRMFSKSSSSQPEKAPKPEVDLSKALPSSDDFRTSLLMTGLSARFSMLREQDDPTTKIGKASDDSVLFHQTQSKLIEEIEPQEGFRDLSEIESLKNSLFSDFDSLASEDQTSPASSIMNRGKPTDGNNLFGGRQKIYRIPANGGGGGRNGGMAGRALYDDDVALSGFQKWKQAEKEKEKEKQMAAEAQAKNAQESESKTSPKGAGTTSAPPSKPSISIQTSNPNPASFATQRTRSIKESQSTCNSQDASPVDKGVTRARRLYEQGLNQELADQQTSAFSRMDSLSKTRVFTPLTPDMQSPIGGTFGDRRQIFAQASAPNLRAFSPSGSTELKSSSGANPPLSPPISESGSQTPLQRQQSNASSVRAQRSLAPDTQTSSLSSEAEAPSQSHQTPSLSIERPDDEDHPAFRRAAPPTPSSLAKRAEDAPALGASSGLSSMVRAHLRSESAASSVYDDENSADPIGSAREASSASGTHTAASRSPSAADDQASKEQDEFARHLADGARRVREKLTTYVDADPDRAVPLPSSPVEPPKELNPPRPSLGLLRSKSSRGSLFDRETREHGRSLRAGISAANISAALPSPRRLPAEIEEARGRTSQTDDESADSVSVGLKAFRQARRELQRVKEVDSPQKTSSGPARPLALRAMSYEPNSAPSPSASVFSRMPRGESRSGLGSRSGSRAPSERERSGSDTSNSGLPARIRNGSVAPEDRLPGSPTNGSRRQPPTSNATIESRPRTASKSAAPPSNMYANMQSGAPPLPPFNPRRINGLKSEEDSPATSPRMPGGFPLNEEVSDDDAVAEQRQRLRRANSEGNSLHDRARTSPTRNEDRPPLPQGGLPSGRSAGAMI